MANFTTEQLRNIVLIGHGSSGKTTLAEAMLFDTGVLSRRGRVEDGTTVADWDEEAIRRRISVGCVGRPVRAQGHQDQHPGHARFSSISSARRRAPSSVADAGLVLVDPVSGVEVGTELGWGYLDERQLPRAVFVNKMDRENAQFERVVGQPARGLQRHDRAGAACRSARAREFKGVVDLIGMKAYMGESAPRSPRSRPTWPARSKRHARSSSRPRPRATTS